MTELTLQNLTFERNDQLLFSNLNCLLQPGDFLQVQGTNGSGKSTLLRIMAGFIEAQEGMVLWHGIPIAILGDSYQKHVQYLGHLNGLRANLTVLENLQLSVALANGKNIHPHDALQKVGLADLKHKLSSQLSAGQARRLAMARLLLNPATVWILDEPTTALDSAGQLLLVDLLNAHLNNEGIVIIATHQPLQLKKNATVLHLGEGVYA